MPLLKVDAKKEHYQKDNETDRTDNIRRLMVIIRRENSQIVNDSYLGD